MERLRAMLSVFFLFLQQWMVFLQVFFEKVLPDFGFFLPTKKNLGNVLPFFMG